MATATNTIPSNIYVLKPNCAFAHDTVLIYKAQINTKYNLHIIITFLTISIYYPLELPQPASLNSLHN